MPLDDWILYQLAKRWKSPKAGQNKRFGAEPGTYAYAMAYARHQYTLKIRKGLGIDILDKEVLEIGCGHGGITCFIAAAGARRVVGIDINTENLRIAQDFRRQYIDERTIQRNLPIHFMEMDATQLAFSPNTFDVVIADNVFEHFMEPEKVLQAVHHILRPGGILHVPIFSSIYSKYGLHLKHGLKMPWANLVFSDAAIIRAMHRLAKDDSKLFELYPGLSHNPQYIRDLRRYGDLNGITFKQFREMVQVSGYRIQHFYPVATTTGKVLNRLPGVQQSILADVFSVGASCTLVKQEVKL
jgi:2-polyprenyl-3-methyl-5-hydroxy-6-metoxy-1,4-benzoquinol methylase